MLHEMHEMDKNVNASGLSVFPDSGLLNEHSIVAI